MVSIFTTHRPKIHIVIPDSHARPGFDNNRYKWLSSLISDIKPDTVIDIGDWFDMESLSSYDKGKKSFEGRRYKLDIEKGVEAQDLLYGPLKRAKKKMPRWVRTLGNHENRIIKHINLSPEFEGVVSMRDLQSKEYGWEEIEYNVPIPIDGIHYCHSFPSGAMGKPIGGENIGRMLLQKKHVSCTQGHSHLFDYAVRSAIDGKKIMGLSVGCFFDYQMDYAGPVNNLYDRGVVVKRNVQNGCYDIEWISMARLKAEYEGR